MGGISVARAGFIVELGMLQSRYVASLLGVTPAKTAQQISDAGMDSEIKRFIGIPDVDQIQYGQFSRWLCLLFHKARGTMPSNLSVPSHY